MIICAGSSQLGNRNEFRVAQPVRVCVCVRHVFNPLSLSPIFVTYSAAENYAHSGHDEHAA